MKKVGYYFDRNPLTSSILLVLVFVGIPFAISSLFTYLFGFELTNVRFVLYNLTLSALLIWLVATTKWDKKIGLTRQMSDWNPKWWLWWLIFVLFQLKALVGVDWQNLTFSKLSVVEWVALNVSIGLKEELLCRGLIFYILYQAWGHTRWGVIKACLVQSAIFGSIHYINVLAGYDIMTVHTQVIATFFIGIAFGGIYLVTGSIWPGIFIHTLIDAIYQMNSQFGTTELQVSAPISLEILPYIAINAILYSTFGILCLVKAPLHSNKIVQ